MRPVTEQARKHLELEGFVVLKQSSYRAAQARQHLAQQRVEWAEEEMASVRRWAEDCLAHERYARDRVTFLYGAAMALGATREDLVGDTP